MSVHVTMATWDDVPHLSQEEKDDIWNNVPEYQREARSKGIPVLGSGNIYQFPESKLTCDDFEIPDNWPRGYGMDVGWKWTAGCWITQSPKTKIYYVYAEYKKGRAEPSEHAEAVKGMDEPWLPGLIDPAANGRSQKDGQQLLQQYRALGLQLNKAVSSIEGGVLKCQRMIHAHQVQVFKSCTEFLKEYRKYRRDLNGNIIKKDDHLMDAFRYFMLSGLDRIYLDEEDGDEEKRRHRYDESMRSSMAEGAWMV